MLRQTQSLQYWRATKQLTPALSSLKGRHRYEPVLGVKTLLRDTIARTQHRVSKQRPWERSINRIGINAVALENGSDGALIRVMNVQSKRTIQAVVIGPNRVRVPYR